jgi:hypothetical protein
MKTLPLILLICLSMGFSCSVATATMQREDYLEFDSKLYRFGNYGDTPLEDYFSRYLAARPKEFKVFCSNLWRGHIAHWRVSNSKLWLVCIYIQDEDAFLEQSTQSLGAMVIYPIQNLFPDQGPSIFADWFSGEIPIHEDPIVRNLVNPDNQQESHVERLIFQKGVLVKFGGKNGMTQNNVIPSTAMSPAEYTSIPTLLRWAGAIVLLLISQLIVNKFARHKWRRLEGEQVVDGKPPEAPQQPR